MTESSEQTTTRLLANALREAQDLIAKQIDLLRAEVGDGIHKLALALVLVIAAAILVVIGLMVFVVALVKGLAVMLGSEVLAALIVGGGFLLVAIGLALWGHSKMSLRNLAPDQTLHALKQDAVIVEEHLRP